MPLPELIRKQVNATLSTFRINKVQPHTNDKLRITYKVRGNSVTMFEERSRWAKPDNGDWTQLIYGPAPSSKS